MDENERSTTSLVYDHLMTLPDSAEFTAADMVKQLGLGPEFLNRVSAALSGWRQKGLLINVDTRRQSPEGGAAFVYRIADRHAAIRVSRKSQAGKKISPHIRRSTSPAITVRSLSERALQLAADIATIEPDLRLVPTEKLLAEIMRRERERSKE